MSHDDHEAGEEVLARIDLHAWRVPPPTAVDRASIVARALAPSVASGTRRMVRAVAAIAFANVAIAVIIAVVIWRLRPDATVVVHSAAGAGSVDVETQRLIRRLEQEQGDLEHKMAELGELRAALEQLALRVRVCEQTTKHEPPGKQPNHDLPVPATVHDLAPTPTPPTTCDEVSCVLTNYQGACCTKYRHSPGPPPPAASPATSTLADSLDRYMIQDGIATVHGAVAACGSSSTVRGVVKIHVHVEPSGRVSDVTVESSPDAKLGECVTAAMRTARFAATQRGSSFRFPAEF